MTPYFRSLLALGAVTTFGTLGACDAGNGSNPFDDTGTPDPTIQSVGGDGSGDVYISAAGVVTLGGSSAGGTQRRATADIGPFLGYEDSATGTTASIYRGESTSGDTAAGVYAWTSQGGFYERVTATTLPTSGTASYSGTYAATLFDGATVNGDITGTANIDVDFDTADVSGTINSRVFKDQSGTTQAATLSDVTLASSVLGNDGLFAGTATGGGFLTGGPSASAGTSGSYEGLVGGATGGEVAGIVTVNHSFANASHNRTEIGAFLAD